MLIFSINISKEYFRLSWNKREYYPKSQTYLHFSAKSKCFKAFWWNYLATDHSKNLTIILFQFYTPLKDIFCIIPRVHRMRLKLWELAKKTFYKQTMEWIRIHSYPPQVILLISLNIPSFVYFIFLWVSLPLQIHIKLSFPISGQKYKVSDVGIQFTFWNGFH